MVAQMTADASGRLSIVATPIGNLEDITLRAIRVLREANLILAEDTRRTAMLCRHHSIATPLRSLHAHSSPERIKQYAAQLREGAHLALVSDAGTPLVSDPGAALVDAAHQSGIRVEPIPGPSAPIAAVVASGFGGASFTFVGFLPRSGGRRTKAISALQRAPGALILFEAPTRLAATLRDLAQTLGPERRAAVCRELTKLHEELVRGTLESLHTHFAEGTLGEITLVIEAGELPTEDIVEVGDSSIDAWLEEGLSTRDIADMIAELERIPRKDAYKRVLAHSRSRSTDDASESPERD